MTKDELIHFLRSDSRAYKDGDFIVFHVQHPGLEAHPNMVYETLWRITSTHVEVVQSWRDPRKDEPANGEFYFDGVYHLSFAATVAYIQQLPKPFSAFGVLVEDALGNKRGSLA